MALTKIETDGVKDDAITLDKLAHGTSSQDGKFLRANNGSAPTFETVSTDLVADTSPQLGGDLQSNGNDIVFADTDKAIFGSGTDLQIHHNGYHSYIQELGTGSLMIESSGTGMYFQKQGTSNRLADFNIDGDVKLFHNANQKFATTSTGATVTGNLSCTALLPTGNLELVDSTAGDVGRIRMGAGDDFSLYHNGSHSFIQNGTGSTYLDTTGNFYIRNGVGNSTYMYASGNEVALYHTGTKKFQTRSDGVEVQSSGSNHGIFVKHSNGNVVAKMQNKGSGDEGFLALYDSGGTGPTIQMDGEHGRITATSIRLHTNDAANELDDYEEGTFTLTLSKSDGSGETSGGTVNYTKIGRWVNCWGQVTFGNASSSIGGSHCYMKGWPFAFGAANSNDVPIWVWNNGTQLQGMDVTMASMSGSTSSTTWGMYVHTYNNAPSITGSQMGNGGRVSLGYSYQA